MPNIYITIPPRLIVIAFAFSALFLVLRTSEFAKRIKYLHMQLKYASLFLVLTALTLLCLDRPSTFEVSFYVGAAAFMVSMRSLFVTFGMDKK